MALHCHLRANREEVPPSSIPNLEVKLFFADDTATFRCGKVGRCGDESIRILLLTISNHLLAITQ